MYHVELAEREELLGGPSVLLAANTLIIVILPAHVDHPNFAFVLLVSLLVHEHVQAEVMFFFLVVSPFCHRGTACRGRPVYIYRI